MKIIVFIKNALDTKIPLECVEETGRLKEDWNVSVLNPDDREAVAQALALKENMPGTHITMVHLGPASGDRFLRDAIALGCDEGLRIWDERLEALHTDGKVLILARVAAILGFDLLFTGTKSLDTGSSQLGLLLAAALHVPCISRVVRIQKIGAGTITAARRLEQGYQECVASTMPLVLSVETAEESPAYARFLSIARAAEATIPCWDLSRIGIPLQAIQRAESRLEFGPLCLPAPRLPFIQPPDSSLPAFERRRQIGEGSTEKRLGRVVRGNEDAVAEELFQALLEGGFLQHLKKEG